jgi:hypothetical protein
MQTAIADDEAARLTCSCVFIEPMKWMGELHGSSGLLCCPGCTLHVGEFNWAGATYVCGCLLSLYVAPVVSNRPCRALNIQMHVLNAH